MIGIISTGGAGPQFSQVEKIWNQDSVIIAADQGLARLTDWGVVADFLVGDLDSWNPRAGEDARETCIAPVNKDESDSELALQKALSLGVSQVILLGGGEGRSDHFLAFYYLLMKFPIIKTWYTAQEVMRVLEPGEYKLSVTLGKTCSFFPLDFSPGRIQSRGLEWELNNVDFTTVMSLSNRYNLESLELNVLNGRFLMMEPYE